MDYNPYRNADSVPTVEELRALGVPVKTFDPITLPPDLLSLADQLWGPSASSKRDVVGLDPYTCSHCQVVTVPRKLPTCARCKKQSYCSKTCQKEHWKQTHKQVCVPQDALSKEESKQLPLTWEQLELFDTAAAPGERLEIRWVSSSGGPGGTTLGQFKDRKGRYRTVQVDVKNTNFEVGCTLTWKNPRVYIFPDGSKGARLTEEELPNLSFKMNPMLLGLNHHARL